MKPSADEICSRTNLHSFLFETFLSKSGKSRPKADFRTGFIYRKGTIKKKNEIRRGKSGSSGSMIIITPSLVKTHFTCYVLLSSSSSFFFCWHQRNI